MPMYLIPIFSTSSLTDMPLVRLSELIMSRRWVRPISEIKRWFIGLKWLEKNEGAGLYTPRSLIRKPKIYTTLEYVWLANFAGQIAELATGLGRLALPKRDGDGDGSVTRPGLYQPLTSIPLDQWERRKTNGRDS